MIHFTDKDWDRIRQTYESFWNGTLGRPILPCLFTGAQPGRDCPKYPLLSFANCSDFSYTPEMIIERYDYELSTYEFYGDSFPFIQTTQFGPGVSAAFLGAKLISAQDTVWFEPLKKIPFKDMHLSYDGDNIWLRRIKDIFRAGMKKWGGNVVIGMTDLGGALDILAALSSTEELLVALYDEPEEILRLIYEIQQLWFRFSDELNDILKGSQGYTDWSSIYTPKPGCILQSDFSYMISPDMFRTFVIDELDGSAAHFFHTFYHMDGIGQLPHLDMLLSSKNIKGIQWVPGEGEQLKKDWSGIYGKISDSGKKIQAYYNLDFHLDEILSVIKRPDDLIKLQFSYPISKKAEIIRKMSKYGDF